MSDSNPEPNGDDIQEEQLNRAIEELRGVLHEEGGPRRQRRFDAVAGMPATTA